MESETPKSAEDYPPIAHSDLVYALTQIDSFIDVSEEDLLRIYALATGHRRSESEAQGEAFDAQNAVTGRVGEIR